MFFLYFDFVLVPVAPRLISRRTIVHLLLRFQFEIFVHFGALSFRMYRILPNQSTSVTSTASTQESRWVRW